MTIGEMDRFERWTSTGVTGVATSRLAPGWVRVGVPVLLALVVIASWRLRSGMLRGALAAVGLYGLVIVGFRTWLIVSARTRAYLVERRDLGDWLRIVALFGAFLGFAALGLLAGFGVLLLMTALDRIARGMG